MPRTAVAPPLDRLLYTDMKSYLVELLMKQDQMSMSASIESRVPFLDHHLVEFAATLPPDRKLSGFTTKRILREAVRDVVPASILDRSKMGFPVPFARWMRGGWGEVAREVLLDRASLERDIVAPVAVEALLDDARDGVHGAADAVWSLLNLELWYRTFIDGGGTQTLPQPRPTAVSARLAPRPRAWSDRHDADARALAECQPAAAPRQGRQAPHLAPDAPPGGSPRRHLL